MKNSVGKKIHLAACALLVSIMATSCHYRGHSTTIVTDDGNHRQRIEYSGYVVFDKENKLIDSMSPDGYLKFEQDGLEIEAEADSKGNITYEFDDGGKTKILSEEGKRFLAIAVNETAKAKAKLNSAK
ncbi:hypothetical protein [Mucilaginibacter segetis]|uniref:Lipoprotein n=1 Tax=Mucilaginibacter segetis TaxID=2793071 RepID=A0A934PSK2_9SPHI|nr:hypothetical protein [Mucilaginibacter segetis]MBK0378645.1 hypothetical protein [Mucilaginibacter segetis]